MSEFHCIYRVFTSPILLFPKEIVASNDILYLLVEY